MSSSRHGRKYRIAGSFLAVGLLLPLLAACQVRPLYDSGGPARAQLASISVSEPDSRLEQEVRNRLIFALGGGAGEPANPQYDLEITVSSSRLDGLTSRVTDDATAGNITVSCAFVLTERKTGRIIISGTRSAFGSYDLPSQNFAKLKAVEDAENRAAREVAEFVRADIAAILTR